jgi:hypothetical protein
MDNSTTCLEPFIEVLWFAFIFIFQNLANFLAHKFFFPLKILCDIIGWKKTKKGFKKKKTGPTKCTRKHSCTQILIRQAREQENIYFEPNNNGCAGFRV